jgi:hypothetical protein
MDTAINFKFSKLPQHKKRRRTCEIEVILESEEFCKLFQKHKEFRTDQREKEGNIHLIGVTRKVDVKLKNKWKSAPRATKKTKH